MSKWRLKMAGERRMAKIITGQQYQLWRHRNGVEENGEMKYEISASISGMAASKNGIENIGDVMAKKAAKIAKSIIMRKKPAKAAITA